MSARFGFPVKILGRKGVKSNDARRWQSNPHLRVSLQYLNEGVFEYLQANRIAMYRMSSDFAPYATHPDLPQFHNQVEECRAELRATGDRAKSYSIRLSFHPSQFIVMNSPDPAIRAKSVWDLRVQASILDAMELGPEAVMVIHVGGLYGETESALNRWCQTWDELPRNVQSRLVLENDDIRFSAADVLRVHERTGVRLVFDVQHFHCLNPQRLEMIPTLDRFLHTWPSGVVPKIHYSSPRTEMRTVMKVDKKTKKKKAILRAPVWTGHADFNSPFEFFRFCRDTAHLHFDVMLEAKGKDLALLRLRHDIVRYAPDLAGRFGLEQETIPDAPEEVEVDLEQLTEAV